VKLSLDTNVLVEVLRGGRTPVRQAFERAVSMGEPLVASIIVAHELYFGAELHAKRSEKLSQARTVLRQLVIEPFDDADMRSAAGLRADLRRRGASIGFYDALIAGQAFARGWTVVTNNTREFRRIEGLEVIDWMEA
jgi:tRNA(fMet)-specific endonuclease VapC